MHSHRWIKLRKVNIQGFKSRLSTNEGRLLIKLSSRRKTCLLSKGGLVKCTSQVRKYILLQTTHMENSSTFHVRLSCNKKLLPKPYHTKELMLHWNSLVSAQGTSDSEALGFPWSNKVSLFNLIEKLKPLKNLIKACRTLTHRWLMLPESNLKVSQLDWLLNLPWNC